MSRRRSCVKHDIQPRLRQCYQQVMMKCVHIHLHDTDVIVV